MVHRQLRAKLCGRIQGGLSQGECTCFHLQCTGFRVVAGALCNASLGVIDCGACEELRSGTEFLALLAQLFVVPAVLSVIVVRRKLDADIGVQEGAIDIDICIQILASETIQALRVHAVWARNRWIAVFLITAMCLWVADQRIKSAQLRQLEWVMDAQTDSRTCSPQPPILPVPQQHVSLHLVLQRQQSPLTAVDSRWLPQHTRQASFIVVVRTLCITLLLNHFSAQISGTKQAPVGWLVSLSWSVYDASTLTLIIVRVVLSKRELGATVPLLQM